MDNKAFRTYYLDIINNIQLDFQELTLSDINYDDTLNVLDIIEITNIILGVDN